MTRSIVLGHRYSSFRPPRSELLLSPSIVVEGEVEETASVVNPENPPVWSTADQHILHLPTDRFALKIPIPVRVFETDDGEWMASFEEASISMQGNDVIDAYVSLLHDVVDAFECLTENRDSLSAFMKWQLSILKDYIIVREA